MKGDAYEKADVRQKQNLRYLPLLPKEVIYWKTGALCRHFGIWKNSRKDGAWIAKKLFRRFAEMYQLPVNYETVAGKAYLLQNIYKGILDIPKRLNAGEIIMTHPLKSLSEEENRMLAATVSCISRRILWKKP